MQQPASTLLLAVAVTVALFQSEAHAATPAPGTLGARIFLSCAVDAPGARRSLVVKNEHHAPIGAHTRIFAALVDPRSPRPTSVLLAADLAPGVGIRLEIPGAGSSARCESWFHAGLPDLTVASLSWGKVTLGSTQLDAARVVITNKNAFAETPFTRTRVVTMTCPDSVLEDNLVATPPIAAGASISLTVIVNRPHRGAYLRAEANAADPIPEGDRSNNVNDQSREVCNPK
jgi:hypothetical protein